MRQGVIYKITSPTGAIYIGQSINVKSRKRLYKNLFCETQRRVYNSIKKHGWEAHSFEIIETCNECDLDEREIYWIAFYDSCNNGMNLNYGGKGNPMSDEGRKKLSEHRKKNPTGTVGNKGENHYNYGKKATPEIRLALSLSHKGLRSGKDNNRFKGYIQAFKDNVFVGRYEGVNDAARKLGLQHPNISKVILGKYKKTGGYTFIREDINNEQKTA